MKRFVMRMLPRQRDLGLWGERRAARHLKRQGFRILGRRVRLGKDEIDLVARDGDVLVFIEVKTRSSTAFGRPLDAVDKRKRRAVSRAAMKYLARLREKPPFIRFDIVEIIVEPGARVRTCHVEGAFNSSVGTHLAW